jgi:GNAT superfamily N-acetyltransferase
VAFLVKEELHGMGIASFLLASLETIAQENHYKQFSATVLAENRKMLKVFQKKYPDAKFVRNGSSEIEVEMPFS